MRDDNDIELPGIPPGDSIDAHISVPDTDEVVPDLATLLAGPGEIDVGSLLFSPAVIPASVVGYAIKGEETLASLEDTLRTRAASTEKGKISKYDAYYAPQTPVPPAAWEYKCETCRFYKPAERGSDEKGACEIVGHDEDWFGGEGVHPEGWCAMWLPNEGKGFIEWATDRLEGEA